ncbi:MAG: PAAR-like domain-containing protein [Methylococcales bacterium]|nr:DUF4150 domain-containing protein [Methylococcaceae bacterium]
MANKVFANGMELACKSGSGKTICAMPDVCFTPPENPATPPGVPIPYPNTGFASDTTEGSKTVKISDKEVMLKNKSYFKKSTGDEAGAAAKKGVISSKNTGKVYFVKWSMDVKFEGENVDRHLDMTTNNHGCTAANEAVPWPFVDSMAVSMETGPCAGDIKKEKVACKDFKPYGTRDACAELKANLPYQSTGRLKNSQKPQNAAQADQLANTAAAHDCINARRCNLTPYEPSKCCSPQTGHHLVEASCFLNDRESSPTTLLPSVKNQLNPAKQKEYHASKAPCVCADGTSNVGGTHGAMHTFQSIASAKAKKLSTDGFITYKQAKKAGIEAMQQVFPYSHCDEKCTEAQLDDYHNKCGIQDDTRIQPVQCGDVSDEAAERITEEINLRYSEILLSKLG